MFILNISEPKNLSIQVFSPWILTKKADKQPYLTTINTKIYSFFMDFLPKKYSQKTYSQGVIKCSKLCFLFDHSGARFTLEYNQTPPLKDQTCVQSMYN